MFSWVFSGSLGEFLAPIPDIGAKFEMYLIRHRYEEAQQLILELANTTDLNACVMNGQNFLHAAAAAGATDVVISLVSHGVDVNHLSSTGSTALHFATKVNNLNVVEYLLRCGADPTIVNQAGSTAADLASDSKIQSLLRESALSAQTEVQPPQTPPRQFVRSVSMKLSTPPARTTATNATPTARRARTVHFSRYGTPIVGSPLTQADDNELKNEVLKAATETAQALRARDHEWKLVKQIFTTVTRWTPKNSEALRATLLDLLRSKPELVNARSCQLGTIADGLTPLHAAAQTGNDEAIRILCEEGNADPWTRDLQGKTPLHLATKAAHETVCETLRAIMRAKRVDPVGEFAPIDLVGSTPLASLDRANPRLAQALFKPGDRAILPTTPWEMRSGTTYEVQALFAHAGAQNFCDYMEDRLVCMCPIQEGEDVCIFGVFDGHGGCFAADFMCSAIVQKLINTSAWQSGDRTVDSLAQGLRSAFLEADAELQRLPQMQIQRVESRSRTGDEDSVSVTYKAGDYSGSTGNIVLLTPTHIIVANVGDSRTVLGSSTPEEEECQSIALSTDHKACLPIEEERIVAAGGIITVHEVPKVNRFKRDATALETNTVYRVKSSASEISLAMARSLGDFMLKSNPKLPREQQIVIADPEIRIHTRSENDELLIICSDGVWDGLSNDEAVRIAANILRSNPEDSARTDWSSPSRILSQGDDQDDLAARTSAQEHQCAKAADALLEAALLNGSTDNMVAIVVDLRPSVTGSAIVGKRLFE